jgi:hypothetical protein
MREALLAVQEGRRRAAEDRAAAAERRARRGQMDSQTAEYKAIKITRDAELQAEEAEREARKAEREARQAEREAERFERQAERFQREAERNARQAERQARQMERDAMQMERDARKMERDAERMQREFIPSAATASTSSSDWVCTDITPDGIYKWRLDSESIEIELWEGLNPNERVPLPGRTIMVKGSLLSNGSREWKTPDGLCTMLLEEGRNPKDNNMSGVIIGGGANGDLRSVVFNGRNGLVVFPKFTCL